MSIKTNKQIHAKTSLSFYYDSDSILIKLLWRWIKWLLVPLLFLYKDAFGIKWPTKVDMPLKLRNQTTPSQAIIIILSYLPTPPLGKDMTQGQFLCGV